MSDHCTDWESGSIFPLVRSGGERGKVKERLSRYQFKFVVPNSQISVQLGSLLDVLMGLGVSELTPGQMRGDGEPVDVQRPDVEVVHLDHAFDTLQVAQHGAARQRSMLTTLQ